MRRKFYFIGIGGIAMSNIAAFLKAKGHIVAGSDTNTFEPALSLLKRAGVKRFSRHAVANLKKFKPDVVIVGNAIVRGNELLEYVMNENILYRSLPEIIREEVIDDKKAVIITGTSGKTTTTALTAWIFKSAGTRPSALVGGIVQNWGTGYLFSLGEWAIVEGDEYSSSFYDKRSKFMYYRPYIGLVNNIGRDHIDLFPRVKDALYSFRQFAGLIPSKGTLLLNRSDKNASSLSDASPSVSFFGGKRDLHAEDVTFDEKGITFTAKGGSKKMGTIRSSLLGIHNVHNIVAAVSLALAADLPFSKIAKGVDSFKGVKRRLETLHENKHIKIIDDFGHNPVKVKASLSALRKHYPKSHIIVAYEPRTASSRRATFQKQYPAAFSPADVAYIAEPFKKQLLGKKEVFSSTRLVRDLNRRKVKAFEIKKADAIVRHIACSLPKEKHTIIVTMSSGDFGGIREKLVKLAKS